MSVNVTVLAVGPFKRDLAEAGHYEFDANVYAGVPEGAPIATEFGYCRTSSTSNALAGALNAELGRPETYLLDNSAILALEPFDLSDDAIVGGLEDHPDEFLERIQALARSNYQLFVRAG